MLDLADDLGGALGPFRLKFVSVDHKWNTQRGEEEAARLKEACHILLGRPWTNQNGETQPISTEDVLVVSQCNMQANLLKRALPPGARVGTVDKFQGQEAAVVLVSMAASDADSAPRGIAFLFEKNRLNAALSRARCLSVCVLFADVARCCVCGSREDDAGEYCLLGEGGRTARS